MLCYGDSIGRFSVTLVMQFVDGRALHRYHRLKKKTCVSLPIETQCRLVYHNMQNYLFIYLLLGG